MHVTAVDIRNSKVKCNMKELKTYDTRLCK